MTGDLESRWGSGKAVILYSGDGCTIVSMEEVGEGVPKRLARDQEHSVNTYSQLVL